MKNTMAGLLLGTLILSTPAAHAALTIDTGEFSISYAESYKLPFDMTLLSSSNGVTRIALHGMEPNSAAVQSYGEPQTANNWNFAWALLTTTVQDGYQIRNASLTGTMTGVRSVGQPGAVCDGCTVETGYAQNAGRFSFGQFGRSLLQQEVTNVDGVQTLAAGGQTAWGGSFDMVLNASLDADALGTRVLTPNGIEYLASNASVSLTEIVLTIEVASPVPEPETYMMLLAGLGVAGWAARRRKA